MNQRGMRYGRGLESLYKSSGIILRDKNRKGDGYFSGSVFGKGPVMEFTDK